MRPGAERLFEMEAASVGGDVLGRRARVLAAVHRAKRVDPAIAFAVVVGLEKRTDVRQFAAGAAVDALASPGRRDRQQAGQRPPDLRTPRIRSRISHAAYPIAAPFPLGRHLIRPRWLQVNRRHRPGILGQDETIMMAMTSGVNGLLRRGYLSRLAGNLHNFSDGSWRSNGLHRESAHLWVQVGYIKFASSRYWKSPIPG